MDVVVAVQEIEAFYYWLNNIEDFIQVVEFLVTEGPPLVDWVRHFHLNENKLSRDNPVLLNWDEIWMSQILKCLYHIYCDVVFVSVKRRYINASHHFILVCVDVSNHENFPVVFSIEKWGLHVGIVLGVWWVSTFLSSCLLRRSFQSSFCFVICIFLFLSVLKLGWCTVAVAEKILLVLVCSDVEVSWLRWLQLVLERVVIHWIVIWRLRYGWFVIRYGREWLKRGLHFLVRL